MTAEAENCCYLCTECGSNFASLANLEAHMESAHTADNNKMEDVVDSVIAASTAALTSQKADTASKNSINFISCFTNKKIGFVDNCRSIRYETA